MYTLGEASKKSGKAKSTISKAIADGKITATKLENGTYQIDPSELGRWLDTFSKKVFTIEHPKTETVTALERDIEHLKDKISMLTNSTEELRRERDDWKHQAKTLLLTDETKRKKRFWDFFSKS